MDEMTQQSPAEDPTAVFGQAFPIQTTAMPITRRHRAVAFGIIALIFFVVIIVAPFANVPLRRVDVFIPVLRTVMCVVDLIIAAILFGQYSIQPKYTLLSIASGYVFSGLFAFLQTLAFPGAYSAAGLIGDGVSSASWLFVFWHVSFDVAIIVYALAKDLDETVRPPIRSAAVAIGVTIALVCGTVVGLTWVVTEGAEYLPALNVGTTKQTSLSSALNAFLWLLNASALLAVYVRRRTILDLWLMVVLLAWWPHFALSFFLPLVRFTLGWYVARVFALLSSSTLLILLLTESMALYARLAGAILLSRRERADRLMSVDEATSAVIHELRQPLAGIELQSAGALRWLGRVPPRPELEQIRQCLNSISAATRRAEDVMKSVRALFRPMPNRRMTIQLNDIIRETLSLVQHNLMLDGISVTTKYDGKLPQITADHTQIQQVILNLIKNAIEAMQSVPRDKRHLQISTGFDGKSVVACYIQDTGPGVATEDRDRMFDPFFTTKPSGTGLGLSICRTIVQKQGGILRLAKTGSFGSNFEVAFPIGADSLHPGY